MPNENENKLKKLEIGKTKIGSKRGMFHGEYREFSIYYGNYVQPIVNGEFYEVNEDVYKNMLEDFLNTDEGREYKVPTVQEFEDASAIVKKKIRNFQTAGSKPSDSEPQKEEELIKPAPDEQPKQGKKSFALSGIFGADTKSKPKQEEAKPDIPESPSANQEQEEPAQNIPTIEDVKNEELQNQVDQLSKEKEELTKQFEKEKEKMSREIETATKKLEIEKRKYKNKMEEVNAPKLERKSNIMFKAVSICTIVLSLLLMVVLFVSLYI